MLVSLAGEAGKKEGGCASLSNVYLGVTLRLVLAVVICMAAGRKAGTR